MAKSSYVIGLSVFMIGQALILGSLIQAKRAIHELTIEHLLTRASVQPRAISVVEGLLGRNYTKQKVEYLGQVYDSYYYKSTLPGNRPLADQDIAILFKDGDVVKIFYLDCGDREAWRWDVAKVEATK